MLVKDRRVPGFELALVPENAIYAFFGVDREALV